MTQTPNPKTRGSLAMIVMGAGISTFVVVLAAYAWKADAVALKDFALLAMGCITTTFGAVVQYYFGKSNG